MTRARNRAQQPQLSAGEALRRRHQVALETAERAGLLRGENGRIAGRVRTELIRLAKERSGLTSDTQLLEYALAKVALEDDFGPKILTRSGRVAKDIDLEF